MPSTTPSLTHPVLKCAWFVVLQTPHIRVVIYFQMCRQYEMPSLHTAIKKLSGRQDSNCYGGDLESALT